MLFHLLFRALYCAFIILSACDIASFNSTLHCIIVLRRDACSEPLGTNFKNREVCRKPVLIYMSFAMSCVYDALELLTGNALELLTGNPKAAGSNLVRGHFSQCLFLTVVVLMTLCGCRSGSPGVLNSNF